MSQASLQAPQQSDEVQVYPIEDAQAPCVQQGVACWRSLCGQRRFPARADLTLRGMAPFLPQSVIVAVIDGGADYEYRYVGDMQRLAFKTYFKGIRVTQIEAFAPRLGGMIRAAYESVRSTGQPFITRGQIGQEISGGIMLYHETAFLPLGADGSTVDHLLIVGVQVPEPFWDIPQAKLKAFGDKIRASVVPG